jgi:EmrB/QacA subfamily drug resistance transporter
MIKELGMPQYETASNGVQPGAGRWVLASTILASAMAFIDSSALNVALPALQAGLNASGAQLLWMVNGYLLVLAALILVGGSLGDELGRKRVFMVGIGLFMLASLACGLAPTADFLIGARLAAGVGGALMIPGSLAIISAYFGAGRRGQAIGTWSSVTTMVTIAGPVLGGLLSNAGLWRGVFLINLPLGAAALTVLYLKVPESRDEESAGKIDYLGALLAAFGLAGLTYGFISAPALGFGDPRVDGSLAGGVAALATFVVVEARREGSGRAMLPLSLFNSRTFAGTNLITLFLYGALNVGGFFISLNLVQAQGYSLAIAGLTFLPSALLLTALSRWSGKVADRYGARLPLIVGPLLVGVAFVVLAHAGLTRGPADYWTTFFPGIVLWGLGMGCTVAPLTTAVMGSVATHHSGTASGVNNAVSRTAGVLAIAVVGAVALIAFATALQARTTALPLPAEARAALQAEAGRLGGAEVPVQVAAADASATKLAIKLAFVDTFRVVMAICAGLAWLSTGVAALLPLSAR